MALPYKKLLFPMINFNKNSLTAALHPEVKTLHEKSMTKSLMTNIQLVFSCFVLLFDDTFLSVDRKERNSKLSPIFSKLTRGSLRDESIYG